MKVYLFVKAALIILTLLFHKRIGIKNAVYRGLKTGAITGAVTGLVFTYALRLSGVGLSADLEYLSVNLTGYLLEMAVIIVIYGIGGGIAGTVWGIAVKEEKRYFKAGLVAVSAAVSILEMVLTMITFIVSSNYYHKENLALR